MTLDFLRFCYFVICYFVFFPIFLFPDEEESYCWGSGEGDSSRSHSFPDGTGNDQLHGTRTVLSGKMGWPRGQPISLQTKQILYIIWNYAINGCKGTTKYWMVQYLKHGILNVWVLQNYKKEANDCKCVPTQRKFNKFLIKKFGRL